MKRNKKQDLRVEGKKVTSGKIAIQEGQIYFYPKGSENEPIFTNVCDCIAVVILMKNGDKYCYHKYYRDAPLKIIQEFEKFNIDKDQIERIAFFGGSLIMTYPNKGDRLVSKRDKLKINYDPKLYHIKDLHYSLKYVKDVKDIEEDFFYECGGFLDSKSYFEDVLDINKENNNSIGNCIAIDGYNDIFYYKPDKPSHFIAYRNIKVMAKILKSLYGNDIVDKIFHFNTKNKSNIIIDKNNNAIISDTDKSTFREPKFQWLDPEEQSRRDVTLKAETIERWASDSSIYSAEDNEYNYNVYEVKPMQRYINNINSLFFNIVNSRFVELSRRLFSPRLDFAKEKRNEDNSYMINLVNQQLELEREQKEEKRLAEEALKECKKRRRQESPSLSLPSLSPGSFRDREKRAKRKLTEGRW